MVQQYFTTGQLPFTLEVSDFADADDSLSQVTLAGNGTVLIVSNEGPNTVFIKIQSDLTAIVAEGSDTFAMLSGSIQRFLMPETCTIIGAICASGKTAKVYFSRGWGM